MFNLFRNQFQNRKKLIKLPISCICLFFTTLLVSGQTAGIVANAKNKGEVNDAVSYLLTAIPAATSASEKKAACIFLGQLYQQAGSYMKAYDAYSDAISLDTANPNVEVRLDAALCALNSGEVSLAETVLDSVLSINPNDNYGAKAKLYAVWCGVLKAQTSEQLDRPIELLESFLDDITMKSVKNTVLFSLWWLTGKDVYAEILKKNYTASPETEIVSGKYFIMPSPYWYLIPRRGNVGFDVSEVVFDQLEQKEDKNDISVVSKTKKTNDRILWYQVGMFRDEDNAERCMQKLVQAGFAPEKQKETRTSGTTYTIIIVRESEKDGITTGEVLRNAGFECYPVYAN